MPALTGHPLHAWVPLLVGGLVACGRTALPIDTGAVATSSSPPDAALTVCPELAETNPWEDLLGAGSLADRGALLACAHVMAYAKDEVSTNPLFLPALGPATNGYHLFVIQYVSEGRKGVARAVTALLYLPSGSPANVPIVAVEHGLSGMGPSCGPSHLPQVTDAFAVPLVGRGYAVVATDYPGMGVDNGMTSYLVGAAEAAATLDALRALRSLHDPRFDAAQLGKDLFIAGHSQGGHAALFAHQLFDPSIGLDLRGSVALAPGLGSARAWASFFQGSWRPVGAMESYAAMSLYARMLYEATPEPSTWLSQTAQATLPEIFHDQCLPDVVFSVVGAFPTLGDLYDPTFLEAAEGCMFDGPCPGFEPWASALIGDEPGRFSSAAPALILQGLADTTVLPSTVTCIVDRLKTFGTPTQACAYAADDHGSIVVAGVPDMIRWIAARRVGDTLDVCPAPLDVPCDMP